MLITPPLPFGGYLLMERIGAGGTAEIFRAVRRGRHPGEKPVALKRLLPHIARDAKICALLQREVGALQRIEHPNVVHLIDHGREGGLPYLVLELVDGCTLRQLLNARAAGDDDQVGLPVCVALWLTREIARGLSAAGRQGIVHRDISPPNIQITLAGDVKILDFGIARVEGLVQTTHGGGLRGKWSYFSPEQVDGRTLDPRSDLFALGSLLYEIIVGTPPFRAATREETMQRILAADYKGLGAAFSDCLGEDWMPDISRPRLELVISQLLGRTADQRPASGEEVSKSVAQLLGASVLTSDHVAGSGLYHHWLAQAVSRVELPKVHVLAQSAEQRGEQVTDPALDDVTQVESGETL